MRYVLLLSLLSIVGCSKGATSSSSTTATLNGVASAAPIAGATVTVYTLKANGQLGAALDTTTTDSNGNYSLSIPEQGGPVFVQLTGGSYTEEAGQNACGQGGSPCASIALGAVLPSVSGLLQVAVTPITQIAAASVMASGNVTSSTINATNNGVAAAFGLTDILAPPLAPTATSSEVSANPKGAAYALQLAVLSEMAFQTGNTDSITMANALAQSYVGGVFTASSVQVGTVGQTVAQAFAANSGSTFEQAMGGATITFQALASPTMANIVAVTPPTLP